MKMSGSQYPLKTLFYRMFSLLVVIPLVVVFLVAAVILNHLMRTSAVNTISAFQETVATTLYTDMKSAALQLSHFVYVNNGEFMELADQAYHSTGSQQYLYSQRLEQAFNTAMVPSQNIIGGHFFMKEGGGVSVKENVSVADEWLRKEGWYTAAMQRPNNVIIGGYDTSKHQLTGNTQKGRQLMLVSAMAPDYITDRSGNIELVAYFTTSQVSEILQSARSAGDMGTTLLLDENGRLLFGDMGDEQLAAWFNANGPGLKEGTFNRRAALEEGEGERNHLFIVSTLPYTGWRIVTFVEQASVTQRVLGVGLALFLVVFGLLSLFYVFSRYFLDSIVMPVQALADGMDRVAANDLTVQLQPAGHQEIRRLIGSFNQMVLSLSNMLAINEEAQKRKHQAEMHALQSQINPHFVVNTLNSIRFMAQMSGFDGIRKMAQALGNVVACSFRSSTSFYTVRQELDLLDSYLYIMRIRYADSFEVRYEVEPDCQECRVPRLTLQPIVENAIVHGFACMEEELGQICIGACRRGDELWLEVSDNGCGMDAAAVEAALNGDPLQPPAGSSVGLKNVLARLRLHFGGQAGVEIESEPGKGARVRLRLPWSGVQAETEKEEQGNDPNPDRG